MAVQKMFGKCIFHGTKAVSVISLGIFLYRHDYFQAGNIMIRISNNFVMTVFAVCCFMFQCFILKVDWWMKTTLIASISLDHLVV